MTRMVASTGDGSSMWPKECKSINECPNDLVMAFAHANFILDTSADLQADEQPPHWKWAFPEELHAHFERVQRKREEKFGPKKSASRDEEPAHGWVENEYARNLRG